jgi:serine/threonine protein kinase
MFPAAFGLERFEVLRELSNNNGGATYKGVVRGTQKAIAVRCMQPHPATSLDINAILQHANKARALNSPYIVHLLEAYESGGIVYLVMDYAEGTFLAPALGTTQISDWELADTSRQICSAIDHAASLHVFHQNLHPGNVIQEWDGTVKLLDYGVSVNPVQRAQNDPGAIRCLHYVSPEQARGGPANRCSNLFSCGAILYEMVTGKKAFSGDHDIDILEQVTSVTPAAPHTTRAGVDPGLSKIIMKALAKSPHERYQTGTELLHDLDHYKDRVTVAPKIVAPAAPQKPMQSAAPVPEPGTAPQAIHVESRPIVPPAKIPIPAATQTKPPDTKPTTTPVPPRPLPNPKPAPLPPVEPATPRLAPTPRSEFLIVGPKPSVPEAPPSPAPQAPVPHAQKPPEAQESAPSLGRRPNPRLLLFAAAAGLVIFVLAAATIVLWLHREKPAAPAQSATLQTAPVQQSVIAEVPSPQPTAPITATSPGKKKKAPAPTPVAVPVPMLGNLSISSAPEGAAIEIDGQTSQFVTPHTAPALAAGSHTIRLSKTGYEPVSRTINLQAGQTVTFNVPLTELRATLIIGSDPAGALVSINGEKSNRTTPVTVMLLKGQYTIALSKQGFLPTESSINAVPGQSYKVSPHLAPLGNADAVKDVGKLKRLFGGGEHSAQMGKVQFRTVPKGALVSVNGKPMKKQTPMELFFPGGSYELTITLPGYKTVQKTITVTENQSQAVEIQLEREPK